jgi:hypothetical protein
MASASGTAPSSSREPNPDPTMAAPKKIDPEAALAAAERALPPPRHLRRRAVYDSLEPAVRTLLRKGYSMTAAVRWLEDGGFWQGDAAARGALYRALCYRINGRGKPRRKQTTAAHLPPTCQ